LIHLKRNLSHERVVSTVASAKRTCRRFGTEGNQTAPLHQYPVQAALPSRLQSRCCCCSGSHISPDCSNPTCGWYRYRHVIIDICVFGMMRATYSGKRIRTAWCSFRHASFATYLKSPWLREAIQWQGRLRVVASYVPLLWFVETRHAHRIAAPTGPGHPHRFAQVS
jgi:hypothetical protein